MIKFRAWDKQEQVMINDYVDGFDSWGLLNVKQFHDDSYSKPLELVLMQSTGLKDKNGVEIFEGDLLNIFYTSDNGQHIHDCIYSVRLNGLGLEFNFVKLLWMDNGYNQLPCSTTLCERY